MIGDAPAGEALAWERSAAATALAAGRGGRRLASPDELGVHPRHAGRVRRTRCAPRSCRARLRLLVADQLHGAVADHDRRRVLDRRWPARGPRAGPRFQVPSFRRQSRSVGLADITSRGSNRPWSSLPGVEPQLSQGISRGQERLAVDPLPQRECALTVTSPQAAGC